MGSNPWIIVSGLVEFNSYVTWNHSYTYACGRADSRKVVTHELGHLQSLGHTNYTAIMHQGAESFWTPQTNDKQGLQAIYGAA
jgi:predicted SprT family Zn-dependent metalloprotease